MALTNSSQLEIGSGSARGGDPFTAGKNAAVQAMSSIRSCPVVAVMAFASVKYDLKKVLHGIRSIIPDVPLFGCTTAGEIFNEAIHESVVVTILASPYMKVSCGLGRDISKDWQSAVDDVITSPAIHPYFEDVTYWQELTLKGKSVFAILFSPGNTRQSTSQSYEILESIKVKSLGRLPLFGGSTADDWRMETNYVFLGDEVAPDGMLLAIFETQLQFGIAMDHGFIPTIRKAMVTRAEGHEVLELDGMPADSVYARMVGSTKEALEGKHLTLTTGHSMGTSDSMGQYSINVASFFTPDRGILFTQPVTSSTVLTLMEPDSEQMLLAGKEALRKAMIRGGITDPALSLVAYCALRPRIVGERSQVEILGMTELLAGSPLVGFCSFGEQGVADDGSIRHNNAVTSVLVLGRELSPNAYVYLENEKMQRTLEQQALVLSQTNKELQNAHDELETRVKERTSELSAANELLRHEIKERKQAEEKLQLLNEMSKKQGEQLEESLSLVRATLESTADGILVVDTNGKLTNYNHRFQEMWGIPDSLVQTGADDQLLAFVLDQLHDPTEFISGVKALYAHPEIESFDVLKFKDGRTFKRYSRPQKIGNQIVGRVWSFRDVSERIRTEETLSAQLRFNEALLGAIPIPVFFKDINGRYLGCNRAFTEVIGISSEELIGKKVHEVWPSEQSEIHHEKDQILFADRTHQRYEFSFPAKQGDTRTMIFDKDLFYDDKGEVAGMVGSLLDITSRIEAENRILESERFIRNILDTVDEGFIVIDRDYRILTANKAFCRQIGGCSEETIGSHCYDPPNKKELSNFEISEDCPARQVFEKGIPTTAVHNYIDAAGNTQYIETKAYPNKNISGAVDTVIVTMNNITEKHLLEEERLKIQKLQAIGTLAGGIAHDFNNILTAILGNLSLARFKQQNPEQVQQRIEEAEKATIRAKDLTQQLLTFARGGEPVKKILSLHNVLQEAAKFALHGTAIQCEFCLAEDLWPVEADEGQLSQVIHNLALNSAQAMPSGGKIFIGAENVIGGNKKFVKITVSDSGCGIPEQDLQRIFDPYFTTKQQGNGLGLATCFSITRKHGGEIKVKSEVGVGSRFEISIPAAEKKSCIAQHAPMETTHGSGRVLVMDDEEQIRKVTIAILEKLGYSVESAENGAQAIELFRSRKEEGISFDIVILDLTIPGGMGGKEVLTILKQIDANVKSIVSSGYSNDPVMANYQNYGFGAVLVKPYRLQEISGVLQELSNVLVTH